MGIYGLYGAHDITAGAYLMKGDILMKLTTLDKLPVGNPAVVTKVGGEGALRCRLLDMGIIPGTGIVIQKVAPMGDPIELRLRGYELSIRLEDARNIEVRAEQSGEASEK